MVMVCQDTIKQFNKDGSFHADGYYLHSTLKDNIDYEYKRINKFWDCCGCIDGEEGSGKTSLGKALCYYVASLSGIKFTVNDIIFTVPQFEEWIENAKPGAACLWDEFVLVGLSTDALTTIQKMTMIRKKRLFILLLIPYIFMLRKYFAVGRTRFLIHVTSPDNLTRGTFDYYSKPNKRHLYILGYKFWEYAVWDGDFKGDFSDYAGYIVDEIAYEKKKDDATNSFNTKEDGKKGDKNYTRMCIGFVNMRNGGLSLEQIAKIFFVEPEYIYQSIKAFELENPNYVTQNPNKAKLYVML